MRPLQKVDGLAPLQLAGLLRRLWPVPGAVTGAALGFQLYFRQPGLNTDSLAPLIFAGLWALGGMLGGMVSTGLAGWLIERGVRRLFSPVRVAGVTLLCLLLLCGGLYAPLEAGLTSWLWPAHQQEAVRPKAPVEPPPCQQEVPSDRALRKAWELECN